MPLGNRIDLRQPSLYDILKIDPSASADAIQAAYRALARAYHPDVNPSPEAADRMRQLNAAYHVLSRPRQRAAYDARRARHSVLAAARQHQRRFGATAQALQAPKQPPATARVVSNRASGSPVARIVLAIAVIAFVVGVTAFAVWLISDALDDTPTPRAAGLESASLVVSQSR